jgi:hypothetical protein
MLNTSLWRIVTFRSAEVCERAGWDLSWANWAKNLVLQFARRRSRKPILRKVARVRFELTTSGYQTLLIDAVQYYETTSTWLYLHIQSAANLWRVVPSSSAKAGDK